jgi:hypothetical protein
MSSGREAGEKQPLEARAVQKHHKHFFSRKSEKEKKYVKHFFLRFFLRFLFVTFCLFYFLFGAPFPCPRAIKYMRV